MSSNVIFGIFCIFFIHPILKPEHKADVSATDLVCPAGSTKDNEQETLSALDKKIIAQMDNGRRLGAFKASQDIFVRMDAESVHCLEREELLTLETTLTLWWHDKFVCWNPADFGNINNVSVKFGHLWMPRLVSYTKSIETFHLPYEYSECTVYSNGTVMCRYNFFLNGICKLQLRDWPIASEAYCLVTLDILNPTGRQRLLHRDSRTSSEWLALAAKTSSGQFKVTDTYREAQGNGVIYLFLFEGTTEAFGHAVITIAAVLSVVLVSSFALPAGSVARLSLLGCVCVSLVLSIGFLGRQLSSVTPDTPHIVRLHGDILIVAAVALLPATLLAPRLTPTKPYNWQLSVRSWLLSSSIGRSFLVIFRVPNPSKEVRTLGDDGTSSFAFQKEDCVASNRDEDSTRMLLFTLVDRVLAALCCLSVFSLWVAMFFASNTGKIALSYIFWAAF